MSQVRKHDADGIAAIQVQNVHKSYGDLHAVRGVSFSVQPGEVVALLGPNGAGKSSLVEILEGHRDATSGTVSVLGQDPHEADADFRNRVGIVLQETGVEQPLTVRETLNLFSGLYRAPRHVDEVIELVGLGEKADARIKTLSGGQKRRVDLALGIIGDPELIFLDEPTTGFDPSARRQAWTMLDGLRALGRTVLLTTHYMDEAQHLADRVIVMRRGEIVAEGSPSELAAAADDTVISFSLPAGVAAADLPQVCGVQEGPMVELHTQDVAAAVHQISGWAMDRGLTLQDLRVERPSLEDIYLGLVAEPDAAAPSNTQETS